MPFGLIPMPLFLEYILPLLAIFFAVFTQSATGFGVALVAMSFLPGLLGIRLAAPLVAVLALFLESILLLRYRAHLNLRAVWPLVAASIVGIPIGVWALRGVDEAIVMRVLGFVLTGFGIYSWLNIRLPELHHPLWGWLVGFLAGLIGGAYNTSGPPVIIYGHCRRWAPQQFKSNLQGFFALNSLFVVGNHLVSGNLNPQVWTYFLLAIPPALLGVYLGTRLDQRLHPELFRRLVLSLLIVMGLKLLITG